jgi:alkyl sulfatase BDS1-like metallo-beta-lactamase superfamily hydrolase
MAASGGRSHFNKTLTQMITVIARTRRAKKIRDGTVSPEAAKIGSQKMKLNIGKHIASLVGLLLTGVLGAGLASARQPEAASASTSQLFAKAQAEFDWSDQQDFADAERGLIARYPAKEIRSADGKLVWTFPDYDAMRHAPVPPTVHPLLWREQQLNSENGLFKVADGVYQLRGFDLANMTIVEGKTGIIVIDPLISVETAHAALELYYAHRPKKPVVAVIYSHSHVDHFGGVRGVVSPEDVAAGKVAIYAPEGFLREAVSENVTAGNAMLRRTIYYSGVLLPKTPYGSVGAGLGYAVGNGRQSFIVPTVEIKQPGETRMIDGVKFVFQSANDTEAPAEMLFYLPQFHVLDMAEVAVHTVHNVLTPRGTQVRDTGKWWKAIERAKESFPEAEVVIGQHHWPTWGKARIASFLTQERDFYKLVHDRALQMTNQGLTMDEIGEALQRTPELAKSWPMQDYYGTLGSAGKAVYQRHIGWYDGNPANLDKLPDAESAADYVRYMGGAEAIMAKAREDYAKGKYRWVAEVLNRLIFAEPDNKYARELQAETLTQLGYQQVSATWRNVYLMAALELRNGVVPIPTGARARDYIGQMPPEMLLDYAGIALSPTRSAGQHLLVNLDFGGAGKTYQVAVDDGLLNYRAGGSAAADATLKLDNNAFDQLVNGRVSFGDAVKQGMVGVTGDAAKAGAFFGLFESFTPNFNIVTP